MRANRARIRPWGEVLVSLMAIGRTLVRIHAGEPPGPVSRPGGSNKLGMHSGPEFARLYRQRQAGPPDSLTLLPTQKSYP